VGSDAALTYSRMSGPIGKRLQTTEATAMSETTPSQPPPPATPALPLQTSTELVHQNGLIGFFDILGYQEFLDANPAEPAAENAAQKVLDALLRLDEEMSQKVLKLFGPDVSEDVAEMVNAIKLFVFSDTVLLTLDLSKVDPQRQGFYWLTFLMQCSSLWMRMFEFGLPLRGAITKGPYLVQKACFAGKPIVEAYQLANDLNCAGVVIAGSVIESFKHIPLKTLHFDYSFPSKTKVFVEHAALNVMFARPENQEKWAGDIRQLVHESFWAHNKSVGLGVP
jgi:hypothetical protein